MDVLPKTFVKIILAAKWLLQHISTRMSSKQQRRPLQFLQITTSIQSMLEAEYNVQVID